MTKLTLSKSKISDAQKQELEKIQHRARIKERLDLIKTLEKQFPNCFNMRQPKPLKLGIEQDILDTIGEDFQISKKKLQRALKYYVLNITYKRTVLDETFRYNLEGKPVAPIDIEHKEEAKRWLSAIAKIKSAQRAQRRRPAPSSFRKKF